MAKVAIKSEKLTPFWGIFSIMEQFDSRLSAVIDSTLGMRCRLYGYQYSEIIRNFYKSRHGEAWREEVRTQSNKPHQGVCLQVHLCASQMGQDIKAVCAEYLFMQQRLCWCVPEWLWITPTTYGRDFAYCLKSHGGVRGVYMSLWWHSMHCAPFLLTMQIMFASVSY